MKQCRTCGNSKDRSKFNKNSAMKDGLSLFCRNCASEKHKSRVARLAIQCNHPTCTVLVTESSKSGLCRKHSARKRSEGTLNRVYNSYGYVTVKAWDHPNSFSNGRIFEHVLVMSEHLGRPLLPHENVHHKNGIRDDNNLSNLELWSKSQPSGQRVADKVEWALEMLALYAPDKLQ